MHILHMFRYRLNEILICIVYYHIAYDDVKKWRQKRHLPKAPLGSFRVILTKKRLNENKIRIWQKRILESSKLVAFWSRRYTRGGQNKKKTIGFFEPGNEDFSLSLNFFYGSSLSLLGVLYL